MKRRLLVLALATLAVVGCAVARNASAQPSPTPSTAGSAPPTAASPAATPIVFLGTHYPSQGHTHLTPDEPDDFVYNSNPPTSGPHREMMTDAFVSATPIPNYVQVHLLEHGDVLLQYNCTCPPIATALASIAMQFDRPLVQSGAAAPAAADVENAEDQGKAVIVARYPHMKSKIALTAWTHLATLSHVDRRLIEAFIHAHLGNPVD